jgi:hypothetical protein
MPAGVISYPIKASPNVWGVAAGIIDFLNNNISSSYVSGKSISSTVPSWALNTNNEPVSSNHSVSSVLTFNYHGVDFCLVSYVREETGVQSQAKLRIYEKHPATNGVATECCCYVNSGDSSTVWNFLLAQSDLYFVFRQTGEGINRYYAVFKVDAPTNPADTNAYISVINSAYFTQAFVGEDITTRAYLISDIGEVSTYTSGNAYDSNFVKNIYNNKIPIYNVYAHSRIYGVRGKITSLAILPNSYSTSSGKLYSINGDEYVGLSRLNGAINSNYPGILLRVV